jgi:hypothetical protein
MIIMVSIIAVMMSMIRSVSFAVTVFRVCGNGSRRRSSRWGLLRGGLSLTNWCFIFRRWNRFRVLHHQSFPKKSRITLGIRHGCRKSRIANIGTK